MKAEQQDKQKRAAKVVLIVILLSILGQLASFYQAQHQLVSPLIPESMILEIVRPFMFMAFITTLVSIIALILFFYKKYLLVIIVGTVAVIWQFVYSYF